MTLLNIYYYINLYNKKIIQKIYERKLVKNMVMTLLYGSGTFSRTRALLHSFQDIAFRDGIYITDKDFILVANFGKTLNHILEQAKI